MANRECTVTLDDDNFVTFVTAKLARILGTDYRIDHEEGKTQNVERLTQDLIMVTTLATEYLKITQKQKSSEVSNEKLETK